MLFACSTTTLPTNSRCQTLQTWRGETLQWAFTWSSNNWRCCMASPTQCCYFTTTHCSIAHFWPLKPQKCPTTNQAVSRDPDHRTRPLHIKTNHWQCRPPSHAVGKIPLKRFQHVGSNAHQVLTNHENVHTWRILQASHGHTIAKHSKPTRICPTDHLQHFEWEKGQQYLR